MLLSQESLQDYIIQVLKEDGMANQTAKNIAFGTQPMNNLPRALKLSKKPYYISMEIWGDIYKGINKIEKKAK